MAPEDTAALPADDERGPLRPEPGSRWSRPQLPRLPGHRMAHGQLLLGAAGDERADTEPQAD